MTPKIELGKTQELIVVKKTDFGVFLNTPTGADSEKILLPKAQVPKGTELKVVLTVFVYKDSEDRPIATTLEPEIELGQVARLYVKEVTRIGAFLEWGLAKDLFLPFKEQLYPVKEGDADWGSLMSGQIAGMVNKKQTASEIIEEMFAQYNEIINGIRNGESI